MLLYKRAYMGKFTKTYTIKKELRHHVIEWAATAFGAIGAILNAQLNIFGFYLFIVGDILWMSFAYKHRHWGLFVLNIVYLILNIYGISVWMHSTL